MISNKGRETRKRRPLRMTKTIERLYKEGKCRECSVVVTRMDFAKILGKFTKVKIQYESSSPPKVKENIEINSPNSNTRLKSNENGMVLIHRNAYHKHPGKELLNAKKSKFNEISTPRRTINILRENNRLKKTPILKDRNSNYNTKSINSNSKQYGIIFINPTSNNHNNDVKNKISLAELLPAIDKNILPSEEWCIDYFPKNEEPKGDKVYDRIAAELEDLMYNEKSDSKPSTTESKIGEEFPSIMDILNDNTTEIATKSETQSNSVEFKTIESRDVEAMLLGKPNATSKVLESNPMDVDNTDMSNLIEDVEQLNAIQEVVKSEDKIQEAKETECINAPHSPSILDEALQKGIEEHLPCDDTQKEITVIKANQNKHDTASNNEKTVDTTDNIVNMVENNEKQDIDLKCESEIKLPSETSSKINSASVTHVVFKKTKNGECYKSVTCPKNLKYSIELEGKSVEFLGAPKFISSLEDLQVLLQIVNESELDNAYVLH